jgi:Zn-dependent protease with chaperone function
MPIRDMGMLLALPRSSMPPDEVDTPISVRRWPTERPLFLLNALAAAGIWLVLFQSPRSFAFVGLSFAMFLIAHIAFVASVRGSAIKVSEDQFPELSARVHGLAARMGLRRVPEVYVMQQDGALNAFATRFLRSHMVVLLADLLEACGDDVAARDMIIGHELGHIRAGHLRGRWLLMPVSFVPFLGAALSRAREYTCDRYGYAAAGHHEGALLGLKILSAGGSFGRRVNNAAFMQQARDLRSAWMLVGQWLGSHPPLSSRVAALTSAHHVAEVTPARQTRHTLQAAAAALIVLILGAVAVSAYLPRLRGDDDVEAEAITEQVMAEHTAQVNRVLEQLKMFIDAERRHGRPLPWDVWELYERWDAASPKDPRLIDPFTDRWYDYEARGTAYRVWSAGPDGSNRTADDIILDSSRGSTPRRRFRTHSPD